MITATVLAVFVTPLFYVLVASAFGSRKRDGAEQPVAAGASALPASKAT
jgi:multidrug efflux pump